ncbi:MAG TPA: 3,4-dihydroxy-2-butanone-4-phosphate synthase [Candidatus Altiarchaeales archaeon]|nr:3,4-dihydroxy-2-butanone-4-phosphate synthase [Candidatus Altiarchaeales archaeon]
MNKLDSAIKALQNGEILLLHDASGREDEVDMIIHAKLVTPQTIQKLRKQAGGLICLATDGPTAEKIGIKHMTDYMLESGEEILKQLCPAKTAYGDKPAFSLWLNHNKTFTGITDTDRALTITEFEKMISQGKHANFPKEFYSPGHVPTLIARDIKKRRGHTELSIQLTKLAGLTPAIVLCEMMGDDCKALSIDDAEKYAQENGLILLDGGAI